MFAQSCTYVFDNGLDLKINIIFVKSLRAVPEKNTLEEVKVLDIGCSLYNFDYMGTPLTKSNYMDAGSRKKKYYSMGKGCLPPQCDFFFF